MKLCVRSSVTSTLKIVPIELTVTGNAGLSGSVIIPANVPPSAPPPQPGQVFAYLPLSAKAIIWFAKGEYQKKDKDQSGKQIGQWTDALGREWFEAENSKFHVRGCVMTRGFEAWIIYTGYKLSKPAQAEEIELATRAQEKILPLPPTIPPTKTATASAD